jgi:hypothetical protein
VAPIRKAAAAQRGVGAMNASESTTKQAWVSNALGGMFLMFVMTVVLEVQAVVPPLPNGLIHLMQLVLLIAAYITIWTQGDFSVSGLRAILIRRKETPYVLMLVPLIALHVFYITEFIRSGKTEIVLSMAFWLEASFLLGSLMCLLALNLIVRYYGNQSKMAAEQ